MAAIRSAGTRRSTSCALGLVGSSASTMLSTWSRCWCTTRCRWPTSGCSPSTSSQPRASARQWHASSFRGSPAADAHPQAPWVCSVSLKTSRTTCSGMLAGVFASVTCELGCLSPTRVSGGAPSKRRANQEKPPVQKESKNDIGVFRISSVSLICIVH